MSAQGYHNWPHGVRQIYALPPYDATLSYSILFEITATGESWTWDSLVLHYSLIRTVTFDARVDRITVTRDVISEVYNLSETLRSAVLLFDDRNVSGVRIAKIWFYELPQNVTGGVLVINGSRFSVRQTIGGTIRVVAPGAVTLLDNPTGLVVPDGADLTDWKWEETNTGVSDTTEWDDDGVWDLSYSSFVGISSTEFRVLLFIDDDTYPGSDDDTYPKRFGFPRLDLQADSSLSGTQVWRWEYFNAALPG